VVQDPHGRPAPLAPDRDARADRPRNRIMAKPVPAATRFRMSRVRRQGTEPELFVRRALRALGWPFRLHVKGLPGSPDIVLPDRRTVLLVNGCFWHGHHCKRGQLPTANETYWTKKIERNRVRDRRTQRRLRAQGWRVFTLWECRLRAWPLDRLSTWLQGLKRRRSARLPSSRPTVRRRRARQSHAPDAGGRHSRSVPVRPSSRP